MSNSVVATKAKLKKLLSCLSQEDFYDVKTAAQSGHLHKELDRIVQDYEKILETAASVINAIHDYNDASDKIEIRRTHNTDAEMTKRDIEFSQSLGAWPSETDTGNNDKAPVTTKLNLRDYPGYSFQPL